MEINDINYSIKHFYLGNSDGKKEALYKNDFENFFYDHENIYEKALSKEIFLILGRKGTGKSLLSEFINKKAKESSVWFCKINSYKEFKFHQLLHLKSDDISPNEYVPIWEWVCLIDLAKLLIDDEGINDTSNKTIIQNFIKNNHFSFSLDTNKLIEVTKEKKIKGSLLKFSADYQRLSKESYGSYLNYLEDLRNMIIKVLSSSKSQYTLFYDELDDRFRSNDVYKNGITSLIKAVDKLNMLFLKNNINAKIVLILRSDIYAILNDPDLNKIKVDNSIELTWGKSLDKSSPLIDLVISKISNSISEFKNFSKDDLVKAFFPENPIKSIPPLHFILQRTFLRPRDIIIYLNLIIENYPDLLCFDGESIRNQDDNYSDFFIQETRNELSGHLEDKQIDESFLLLKQYSRKFFDYDDIKSYYEAHSSNFRNIDLDETLKILFNHSVIGNMRTAKTSLKYYWAYRDHRAQVDFTKKIVVHFGFNRGLSL